MEHYDPQLAQRVWQRVQSKQPDTPHSDIYLLLQQETAELSRYLQLQSAMDSTAKPLIQQLISQTRHCISLLRGIGFLLTDQLPETKTYPLSKELPVSALRRCYGATMQRTRLYETWQYHPEYGPGFQFLRDLSIQRCGHLLQLLGN